MRIEDLSGSQVILSGGAEIRTHFRAEDLHVICGMIANMYEHNRVRAIKHARALTGAGLREAKEWAEECHAELYREPGEG